MGTLGWAGINFRKGGGSWIENYFLRGQLLLATYCMMLGSSMVVSCFGKDFDLVNYVLQSLFIAWPPERETNSCSESCFGFALRSFPLTFSSCCKGQVF